MQWKLIVCANWSLKNPMHFSKKILHTKVAFPLFSLNKKYFEKKKRNNYLNTIKKLCANRTQDYFLMTTYHKRNNFKPLYPFKRPDFKHVASKGFIEIRKKMWFQHWGVWNMEHTQCAQSGGNFTLCYWYLLTIKIGLFEKFISRCFFPQLFKTLASRWCLFSAPST